MWKVNEAENFDVITKDYKFTMVSRVTLIIDEEVKNKSPQNRTSMVRVLAETRSGRLLNADQKLHPLSH
jgi:predicted nucleotidyltransferase